MALTKADRDALPESDFAVPGKRALPMHDANHTRLAWDAVDRTGDLTDAERKTARERILHRAKELGIDTAKWAKLKAMRFEVESLEAMALDIPHVDDHPNRVPFSGVLTKVDQPSDRPVHGSLGKLVIMPRAVAEAALPSLLGMGVDFMPGLDGHDPKAKIGIFTAASIEGDELQVEGFFYAADFPDEVAQIQADKAKLGFSYETAQNFVESLDSEFLILTACTFTGAAVLRKDKAAYQTTRLAASAAGDLNMTPEEFAAALSVALKPISDEIATLKAGQATLTTGLQASKEAQAKVKPHADALRACADAMSASGIGQHPTSGHVVKLNRMADSMEAAAALGETPHIYRDHDYAGGSWNAGADNRTQAPAESPEVAALKASMASLETTIRDLKAARSDNTPAPERKTLSPQITALLARAGSGPDGDGKVQVGALDAALAADPSLSIRQRMTIKQQLIRNDQLVH